MIGLVLGIGAGVGAGSFKEFSDTSVRDAGMLTQATSYPVLASIPVIVLAGDIGNKRNTWIWAGVGLLIFAVCGLIIFNYFIMDLDIFWVKLLGRLGI